MMMGVMAAAAVVVVVAVTVAVAAAAAVEAGMAQIIDEIRQLIAQGGIIKAEILLDLLKIVRASFLFAPCHENGIFDSDQATSRVITQAPRVSAVIQPGNSQTHTDPSRPTEALCKCSLPTAERTVVKESANQGRKFRTCGNNNTCDFFEWVDGPSSSTHGLTAAPPKRKQPVRLLLI